MVSNVLLHHLLFREDTVDSHGEVVHVTGLLRYGGDNRWELRTELTNERGDQLLVPTKEVMGTTALIGWVLQRDTEAGKSADHATQSTDADKGDDRPIVFGPNALRLREIAMQLNMNYCVEYLGGWLDGTWHPTEKEPAVRILDIKGIKEYGVWIRVYRSLFDVDTNFGPAYLYPPDADRSAKLVFKPGSSLSGERVVSVPKFLLPKIEALMPALIDMTAKRKAKTHSVPIVFSDVQT